MRSIYHNSSRDTHSVYGINVIKKYYKKIKKKLDMRRGSTYTRIIVNKEGKTMNDDTLKIEKMIEIGGKLWEKNGKSRVYFNNLNELMGLELSFYGTGNISAAWLNGERISNVKARKIGCNGISKVYYDIDDKNFHGTGLCSEAFDLIVEKIKEKINENA